MAIVKTDAYDVQVGQALDLRTVRTDVASRDNIPTVIRYPGLIVYTRNEDTYWVWPQGATSNADWRPLTGSSAKSEVFFSATAPAGAVGVDGDIYFHSTPVGIKLYQKKLGDWGLPLGTFPIGGAGAGVLVTLNNAVAYGVTSSAWLEGQYPDSNPGDIVYSEVNFVQFTKLAANKWSVQNIEIA